MLTDYKLKRVVEHDDGKQTVEFVFYEGEITTEDEIDTDGRLVPVTRYRRTKKLRERSVTLESVESLDRIQKRLNNILARDESRSPITEQTDA